MIIRINRGTMMNCIPLQAAGCGAASIPLGDIYIIMRRMGPGVCVTEPAVWNEGCGSFSLIPCGYLARRRVPNPGIKYCAFKRDDAGNVCFLWDSKLLTALPGRYRGDLFICNEFRGCLDFMLGDRLLTGVGTEQQADCCPTSCP